MILQFFFVFLIQILAPFWHARTEVTSENPIISWLQGRLDWEYDDVFHFKCSMNGTRPASQLSWLLNGQPVLEN
jgi:hypothetical protein